MLEGRRGVSVSVHPERFSRRLGPLTSPPSPQIPLSPLFPLHTGHSPTTPAFPTLTLKHGGWGSSVPPRSGPNRNAGLHSMSFRRSIMVTTRLYNHSWSVCRHSASGVLRFPLLPFLSRPIRRPGAGAVTLDERLFFICSARLHFAADYQCTKASQ